MGTNGNGTHINGNGVLSTKSVQDLLTEFEATGDQRPFEEIVRRYAGMVYNVCYGVSKDAHDAEDATQAVFLTLAVRSKTAQKIQYLGPWLQRVAQRLSLDMKRSKKRRGAREMKHHDINVGRWNDAAMPHDLGMDELRGILRDEIDKLPTKYRMPLILHYFGGLKPEEMSKELGIKANTLGVRLHRARKMLGDNLQRRGIVVGGTVLAAALATLVPMYIQHTLANKAAQAAAHYAVGHSLVNAEISANVLGLVNSARRAAIMGKIKAVTAAVAIAASAVAGGNELYRQVQGGGFELRQMFDLKRLLSPLFDRLSTPIRLSEGKSPADELIGPTTLDGIDRSQLTFADPMAVQFQLADAGALPGALHEQILATPRYAGGESLTLQRTPIAAPVKFDPTTAFYAPPVRVTQARSTSFGVAPLSDARPATVARPSAFSAGPIPSAITPSVSLDARFSQARGSFTQSDGVLDRPSITLDSGAALQAFHVAGGSVRAERIVVGDTGSAQMTQSGGVVSTEHLSLAVGPDSVGSYRLSNDAALVATRQDIGGAGVGRFEQTGGTNTAQDIAMGVAAGGIGEYAIRGGQIFTNDLRVGVDGTGIFTQTGGTTLVRSTRPDGGILIAQGAGSQGTLTQRNGTISADNVFVAVQGDGQFIVNNGKTVASRLILGAGGESDAQFRATDGVIVFNNAAGTVASLNAREHAVAPGTDRSPAAAWSNLAGNTTPNQIVVGLAGDAEVVLGNHSTSPRLREATSTSSTSIINRATPGAQGVIRGWGDSNLKGAIEQNGKIIADGMGKRRALDFSEAAGVHNAIDNDADGANGFYAQRRGVLSLPPIHVHTAGQYNWGESATDAVPDLVNSVRIGFEDVQTPGSASISLLSPDLAEGDSAPPSGELFVGLWKLDRERLQADADNLLIRYDEQMVEHIGLSESALSLLTYADGEWSAVAQDALVLDMDRNLIGAKINEGDFSLFAVSLSTRMPIGDAAMGEFESMYTPGLVGDGSGPSLAFIDQARLAPVALTSGGSVVPEPASIGLVVSAMCLLGRRRRDRSGRA